MTIPDDLPEPVRRLVKPRLALRTERLGLADILAGAWGGSGVVPLPAGVRGEREPEHWVTVECDWLDRNGFGLRGCISVYAVSSLEFVAVNDPTATLAGAGGRPLYGREEWSLPDEPAVEAYVPSDKWPRLGPDYFRLAQKNCPLFRDDVAMVLGGWHVQWPDGPPRLPALAELNARIDRSGGPGTLTAAVTFPMEPYRLAVWTLLDSEPWVEVWVGPAGELYAVARIT